MLCILLPQSFSLHLFFLPSSIFWNLIPIQTPSTIAALGQHQASPPPPPPLFLAKTRMETEQTTVILPSTDPYDEIPSLDLSSIFTESPTLDPPELQFSYPDPQPGYESIDIMDSDDPLSDPVIWALCNDTENDNIPMPISEYPVQRSRYNCTCCERLRVITHINGVDVKRLEIHGRLGIISHAVLEKYDFDSCFESQEYQMLDFQKESTQCVKRFLVQYFEACKQDGYYMLQDPLSSFYEALCVGLNDDENIGDFIQLSPQNTSDCTTNNQPEMLKQPEDTSIKIPLAMQRARTGKLKLKDFIDYFEFPIEVAARKMNICPTVMKKICRKNGMYRWPYRKIRSIKSKIEKKNATLEASDDDEEKARALADIQRHEEELASIYKAYLEQTTYT